MKKSFIVLTAIAAAVLLFAGCAATQAQPKASPTGTQTPAQASSAAPTKVQPQAKTPDPSAAATQKQLQPADAAKAAAEADTSGAPYFAAYEYDETHYLVSAYQTQVGPGSYSGGGNVFLVEKQTGNVTPGDDADVSRVDFSKFLAVYSKLSGKMVE